MTTKSKEKLRKSKIRQSLVLISAFVGFLAALFAVFDGFCKYFGVGCKAVQVPVPAPTVEWSNWEIREPAYHTVIADSQNTYQICFDYGDGEHGQILIDHSNRIPTTVGYLRIPMGACQNFKAETGQPNIGIVVDRDPGATWGKGRYRIVGN